MRSSLPSNAVSPPSRFVLEGVARWRVTLGFLLGAAVWWLAKPTRLSLAVGVAIAMVGECLRVWAAGHLNKSREVTSSGPYRWFAHPLYLGSSVIGAGLAVASHRPAVAVLIAAYLALTLTVAITSEEAFLRRLFGEQYERYQHGGVVGAPDRRFVFARVFANREHRAIIGLAIAGVLLLLKVIS